MLNLPPEICSILIASSPPTIPKFTKTIKRVSRHSHPLMQSRKQKWTLALHVPRKLSSIPIHSHLYSPITLWLLEPLLHRWHSLLDRHFHWHLFSLRQDSDRIVPSEDQRRVVGNCWQGRQWRVGPRLCQSLLCWVFTLCRWELQDTDGEPVYDDSSCRGVDGRYWGRSQTYRYWRVAQQQALLRTTH